MTLSREQVAERLSCALFANKGFGIDAQTDAVLAMLAEEAKELEAVHQGYHIRDVLVCDRLRDERKELEAQVAALREALTGLVDPKACTCANDRGCTDGHYADCPSEIAARAVLALRSKPCGS